MGAYPCVRGASRFDKLKRNYESVVAMASMALWGTYVKR